MARALLFALVLAAAACPSASASCLVVGDSIAAEQGDAVRGFAPGRDGIHPRSYRALARSIPMAR